VAYLGAARQEEGDLWECWQQSRDRVDIHADYVVGRQLVPEEAQETPSAAAKVKAGNGGDRGSGGTEVSI